MPLKATKFEFKNDPPRYSCSKNVDKSFSRMWCYESCLMGPAELSCNCSLVASRGTRKTCTTKEFLGCFAKFYYLDAMQGRQEVGSIIGCAESKRICAHPFVLPAYLFNKISSNHQHGCRNPLCITLKSCL